LKIRLFVLTRCTKVTDTQTDTQTPHDGQARACIASRGKKQKLTGSQPSLLDYYTELNRKILMINELPNKCIEDDTKATARRSTNCIRKTKKYVLWNSCICFIAEILCKTASPRKISLKSCSRLLSYGQDKIFNTACVRHI